MPTKTKTKKQEAPRKPSLAEAADRAVLDVEEALTVRERDEGAIVVRQERDLFDASRYGPAFQALLAYAHLGAVARERS